MELMLDFNFLKSLQTKRRIGLTTNINTHKRNKYLISSQWFSSVGWLMIWLKKLCYFYVQNIFIPHLVVLSKNRAVKFNWFQNFMLAIDQRSQSTKMHNEAEIPTTSIILSKQKYLPWENFATHHYNNIQSCLIFRNANAIPQICLWVPRRDWSGDNDDCLEDTNKNGHSNQVSIFQCFIVYSFSSNSGYCFSY